MTTTSMTKENITDIIWWDFQGDRTKLELEGPYEQRVDVDSKEMEGYFFLHITRELVHDDDDAFVMTFTREQAVQMANLLLKGLLKNPEN